MSACNFCPRPGACCKGFVLNVTFWVHEGFGGPMRLMAEGPYPFIPVEPVGEQWHDEYHNRDYTKWQFNCSNLTLEGRCGDYENRPDTCRDYEPQSDGLCALHGSRALPLL